MLKKSLQAVSSLVLLVACAWPQTTVTTSGGTANTVPVFTGNSSIGNSAITQSNGNVGIGVNAPQTALQVGNDFTGSAEATSHGLVLIQGTEDINAGANGLEFKTSAYGSGFGWKLFSPDRGNGNAPLSFAYRANSATWTELLTLRTDNGNVGIGTTSPASKFHVSGGQIRGDLALITGSSDNCGMGLILPNGTSTGSQPSAIGSFPTATSDQWVIGHTGPCWNFANTGLNFIYHSPGNTLFTALSLNSSGNVGIGTTSPSYKLDVNGPINALMAPAGFSSWSGDVNAPYGITLSAAGNNAGIFGRQRNASGWPAYTDMIFYAGNDGDERFEWYPGVWSGSGDSLGNEAMDLNAFTGQLYVRGNLGIGTGAPGAKLEVNGTVKLSAGSGGGVVFPDGTTQTTAWTGALCGGDYAESVGVSGERAQYEPGDVLVIDTSHSDGFTRSTEPYSSSIAGIYSTKPGAVGRRSVDPDKIKSEIPMAMVGIVPTKVSAENGPIRRGDLLVTASRLGYAMKGTDRMRMTGAIVGKALSNLDSGIGVIDVLVSLQ